MPRYLIALAALVATCLAPARGQESDGRYVPIPFAGNFESLFKQRMRAAKDIQPFLKLVDRIHPEHVKKLDWLRDLDLENPATRQMLKGVLDKYQGETKFTPVELARLKKEIQNIKPSLPAPGDFTPPQNAGDRWPAPSDSGLSKAVKPHPDLLDRWLRDLAHHADETDLADWLKDSTAVQTALGNFKALDRLESDPFPWAFGDVPESLRFADKMNFGLGDGILDRLRGISLPDMPRVTLPHVKLPRVSLGGWSAPSVSMPRLGGARFAESLVWAIVIVVTAVLGWHLVKKVGTRGARLPAADLVGPWPVDPACVATRRQLIQAFDHLAILLLGTKARSWNHRAVAGRLSAACGHAEAAHELAFLYEEARYTAGPDVLGADAQEAARRQLCLLAGVPTLGVPTLGVQAS